MKSHFALASLAALAPHVWAQQQPQPSPADPAAAVPAARYESVFTGYRGFREEPLASWRGVNEEVARAGGHIGILKGAPGTGGSAGSPASAPAPASTPGPKPPAAGRKGGTHAH